MYYRKNSSIVLQKLDEDSKDNVKPNSKVSYSNNFTYNKPNVNNSNTNEFKSGYKEPKLSTEINFTKTPILSKSSSVTTNNILYKPTEKGYKDPDEKPTITLTDDTTTTKSSGPMVLRRHKHRLNRIN